MIFFSFLLPVYLSVDEALPKWDLVIKAKNILPGKQILSLNVDLRKGGSEQKQNGRLFS